MHDPVTNYFQYPDVKGHFGQFGGVFVAKTLLNEMRMMMGAKNRSVA